MEAIKQRRWKRVTEMGGVTREDQGWGECGSVSDRRQDQHRNDRRPAPESKRDLGWEQIREEGMPKFQRAI